jgi:Spy/CpxP family protein refolding chaperone
MKASGSITTQLAALLLTLVAEQSAAYADVPTPPYNKLNLNEHQTRQIASLDSDWTSKYQDLKPQLIEQQRRLAQLLASPKSDPLEITATQQHINQLKEQLSGAATATYLRKRRVLNSDQQQGLEDWMKQRLIQKIKPAPSQGM